MDKSSNKITGLSAKSVMSKSSRDGRAITGLKFRGSMSDNVGSVIQGNMPSKSKTESMKQKSV